MRWIAVLPVIVISTACVHHPKYPDGWSSLKNSIGLNCTDLSGVYEGREIDGTDSRLTLAYMLERQNDQSTSNFRRFDVNRLTDVRLTIALPQVTAELLAEDEVIGSIDLGAPKRSAACDGHVLKLRQLTSAAAPFAFGVGRYSTFLYRASDGSLVMRAGADDTIVALIVPIAASEFSWYRFAPTLKR